MQPLNKIPVAIKDLDARSMPAIRKAAKLAKASAPARATMTCVRRPPAEPTDGSVFRRSRSTPMSRPTANATTNPAAGDPQNDSRNVIARSVRGQIELEAQPQRERVV